MTGFRPTRWYRFLGLLVALLLLGGIVFSATAENADAAVSGGNIGAIANGQVGNGCGSYYGCPYPGEWCAEFAKWVWQHGDEDVANITGAAGSIYQYGQSHGTLSSSPRVGDVVVFGYNGNGYAQHAAIVVSVGSGTIVSVGGNERGGAGVVAKDGPYGSALGYSSYWGMTISGYVAPVGGSNACPATIQNGSTGALVQALQSDLNYDDGAGLAVDGQFGPLTTSAVKTFQSKKGLAVDGVVGPNTWHALGAC